MQTEPQNIDTDGDGLTDGQEVLTFGTNPRDTDSDDGSVDDFEEVERGTDPLNPEDDLEPDCDDGISNDFDGLVDYPADPGCLSSADNELGPVECDNGVDDDGDGNVDSPADLNCPDPTGESELSACGADDTVNRVYTTLEGVAALGAIALPDPDFGTFSLGVRWCVGDDGPVIEQANPTASLSGNWVFLGALEELGLEAFHTPGTSSINGNEAFGYARYGVDVSPAVMLANFLPASKLLKLLEDAARQFRKDKKRFGENEALRAFRQEAKRLVDEFEHKFKRAIVKKVDSIPGVSLSAAAEFAVLFTFSIEVAGDRLVNKLDEVPAEWLYEKIFKKVFGAVEVELWQVDAGIRVHADGSYEFLDDSWSWPLFEETWTETSTGR